MPLGKKGEIWRGCEHTRGCLKGLEVPKIPGGPNSVEKRSPERTRGVLRCRHGQEMPLGKKGAIWRGCEETGGCLRGLGEQKRAAGPKEIWGAHFCGKQGSRVHWRGAKASTWSRNASGEKGRNLEELRGH